MLVIDASATLELLLERPGADAVSTLVQAHDHDLHAPHVIDLEVLNALRRLTVSGPASPERAGAAATDLADLPIERYPHDLLAPRIWQLRENFSAYDAAYVSLAEALDEQGLRFVTTDRRLARAVETHTDVAVIVP